MVTRSPRARDGGRSPSGQHFLKSRKLAADLVAASNVVDSDLVLEIGAGRGKITQELASRAQRVLAIENDPALAHLLLDRFKGQSEVLVVIGDAFSIPLPAERFRGRFILDSSNTAPNQLARQVAQWLDEVGRLHS